MSTASSPSEFADTFPEKDLELPEELRPELAKPFGRLVPVSALRKQVEGSPRLITVGDVVTITLLQLKMEPDVAVFDYRTQRTEDVKSKNRISRMSGRVVKVENPAGKITRALWRAVKEAVQARDRVKIEVIGEEDLAALVAIAMAPEGAHVIYGLPQRGLVVVDIDDENRSKAAAVIRRMAR